ncbi:P-loop containing nucleoside triphosphate hydrolase protein [Chiua virens]|nr:P-loop containing nucleoside triphosphate hydrolase protein [Chiua virens]
MPDTIHRSLVPVAGSLPVEHTPGSQTEIQELTIELSRSENELTSRTSTAHDGMLNLESLIKGIVKQSGEDGVGIRKLGIVFRDLRVVGLGVGTAVRHNLISLFYPQSIIKSINNLRHPSVRDIISGFGGVVLPGEMLLVLGRPGSGCSTLLKTLANHRGEYHDVLGDVFYDSFTPYEISQRYRGDVTYCPEDDVHFPTLTVEETLAFASTMRTPSRSEDKSRKAYAVHTTELLMRIFGLGHARQTVVGDASIRGISGGEKRRVSLAETMSAKGKLACWDNSTRGLDSSTALEFIQALRIATDTAKVTTVVSIYQAGEQLFDLFDKVCVIREGKMVYFGPAREVKQYFIDMGYEPHHRQTTPDFLVASTDPNARKLRPEFQGVVPCTADEMAAYFWESKFGNLNRSSIDSYHNIYVNKPDLRVAYEASVASEHAQHASNGQSYTLSVPMQVRAVMRRRWQILKGDWATQAVQLGALMVQAVLIGTVFLRITEDTGAYFSRGSVMFFALFCGSLAALAEIPGLFAQRSIILRHQKGALYYPFIESLAHIIVDLPVSLTSSVFTSVILYFLIGLQRTTQQYFTFLLFTFVVVLVMKACFRSVAACSTGESTANATGGVLTLFLILFAGYATPSDNIIGALRWITNTNPFRFAFESLMVNEFHTINGLCTTLVPSGPGYESATLANQVCTTVGSQPGMTTVPGDAYINVTFGYSYSNLWKNLGILFAFYVGFLAILLFFTQYNKRAVRDTTMTLFKAGSNRMLVNQVVDEEKAAPAYLNEKCDGSGTAHDNVTYNHWKTTSTDIFSWKSINYDIPVSGGDIRRLLDDVSGYVALGKLTALMGESGAGKTTLLNVLAQRVSVGVVRGDCLVNGHPLPVDFQAQTAYVQQTDTHIPETTVREALCFSANLRQPTYVPTAEKEAYVDNCLKTCGLEAYADAIVGSLGVEYRKRTTIGVELAAKPKLLLFLDEPTSGLDSQSAWAIVTLLRELADSGQAILCTIHQPSAELFQLFDRLLLLRKGGQTVYSGDIGEKSTTVIEYFQRNGAPRCSENANPAEYMLDVIGAGATATCTTDWNQIWKDSPEAARLETELEQIHADGRSRPVVSTASTFKVCKLLDKATCFTHLPRYCVCLVSGILMALTFYQSPNSLQGCQDRLFSIFMAITLCVPIGQQLQPRFMESRTIYEIRERPSRTFTWTAFVISQILIEIPWNVLGVSLFFVCWYWTAGFDPSRAGFSYLLFGLVYPVYFTTFALAAAVISPTVVIASTLFTTLLSFAIIFTGVLERYSQMGWWKWMYHISPLTYTIDGLLGQSIGHQLITCAPNELVSINPPSGMMCSAYMNPYISFAGGYLTNPNATIDCHFCPFRTTGRVYAADL